MSADPLTPIPCPQMEGVSLIQPDGYFRLFFHDNACRFDRVEVEVPLQLKSPNSLESLRQLTLISGAALPCTAPFTHLYYDVFECPGQGYRLVLKAQVNLPDGVRATGIEFRFGDYLDFHQDILMERTVVLGEPILKVHQLIEITICCLL